MKKYLMRCFLLMIMFLALPAYSFIYIENVDEDSQVFYSPSLNEWSKDSNMEDSIVLTKNLSYAGGTCSEYLYTDLSRGFSLNSNIEFIRNNQLIALNTTSLKFSKIVYNDSSFEEVELPELELQKLFPEAEIIKMSSFEDDKLVLKKPLFKKKTYILVNDTNEYFYKLTGKPKFSQKTNIPNILNIPRIGIYRFKHFGKKDGKLTIYVI